MASDLKPALAGSAILHLSLLAATLIAWPHIEKPLVMASSVPVTLVAKAPAADVRPAEQAPEPQAAAAPEPAAQVPPEPEPAPPPPPAPTPPTPAPTPPPPRLDLDALAAKLKPVKPKLDLNALAKQPIQRPQPKLDLNALAARPIKPSNAPKGPARPETAAQARPALGQAQGLSADEASLLAAKLNRLWNPNCGAEGAADVQVRVDMHLTPTGALASPPSLVGGQANSPIWQAAAQRALGAVSRGAPYDELPKERYNVWKDVVFVFNGRTACGGV